MYIKCILGRMTLLAWMSTRVKIMQSKKADVSTPLQSDPAGLPQHDALLQTVDAGVLCTVLNNLARPEVS